ncbi:MAG: SDR family NAD(P)-dependent oxidoreductase, partial [Anaerolineae bacterium]
MATYLVTGGAGFIGSHIVHALVAQGKQVRVLDNLSTGNLANIQDVLDQITFIKGDITDLNTVREAVWGVDYVLHQAALPSVPLSIERPLDTDMANVRGTLHLLVAAREAGVKRFVFASSSSVYGEQERSAKVETMLPAPISPYGASKAAGEMYCLAF